MEAKYYYKDGSILNYEDDNKILHREDGPAIEWNDGDRWWYLNGKEYSQTKFEAIIKHVNSMSNEEKLNDKRQWVRNIVKRCPYCFNIIENNKCSICNA